MLPAPRRRHFLNEGIPTKGRRDDSQEWRGLPEPALNEGLSTKGRRARHGRHADQISGALNEGLPTKGRRGPPRPPPVAGRRPSMKASPRRGGEAQRPLARPLRPRPSTKASPRRGGEPGGGGGYPREAPPPQRRPPHEGEARWKALTDAAVAAGPQRRPPHEGEARSWFGGSGRSSTSALNEGLPTKGRRARDVPSTPSRVVPQRRPPHEGEARQGAPSLPLPDSGPSTKASPRRGGELGAAGLPVRGLVPSTKASPRRGGEMNRNSAHGWARHPQRRPPHEGEASMARTCRTYS